METEKLVRVRYSSPQFTSSLRGRQFVDSISEPMTMREAKALVAAASCTIIEEVQVEKVVEVTTVPAPVGEVTEPATVEPSAAPEPKPVKTYEHKADRGSGKKAS